MVIEILLAVVGHGVPCLFGGWYMTSGSNVRASLTECWNDSASAWSYVNDNYYNLSLPYRYDRMTPMDINGLPCVVGGMSNGVQPSNLITCFNGTARKTISSSSNYYVLSATSGSSAVEFGPPVDNGAGGLPIRIGGSQVAVGGSNVFGGSTAYLTAYDGVLQAATPRTLSQVFRNLTTARESAGAFAYNGLMCVGGGEDQSVQMSSTECVNPNTGAWTAGPSFITPRAGWTPLIVNGWWCLFGGSNGGSDVRSVECLLPSKRPSIYPRPTLAQINSSSLTWQVVNNITVPAASSFVLHTHFNIDDLQCVGSQGDPPNNVAGNVYCLNQTAIDYYNINYNTPPAFPLGGSDLWIQYPTFLQSRSAAAVLYITWLPPTPSPTRSPTQSPTEAPTLSPTLSPTRSPTNSPTINPTRSPTLIPTIAPTISPTTSPTLSPTTSPTLGPTIAPTLSPTQSPTLRPSLAPSRTPTASIDLTGSGIPGPGQVALVLTVTRNNTNSSSGLTPAEVLFILQSLFASLNISEPLNPSDISLTPSSSSSSSQGPTIVIVLPDDPIATQINVVLQQNPDINVPGYNVRKVTLQWPSIFLILQSLTEAQIFILIAVVIFILLLVVLLHWRRKALAHLPCLVGVLTSGFSFASHTWFLSALGHGTYNANDDTTKNIFYPFFIAFAVCFALPVACNAVVMSLSIRKVKQNDPDLRHWTVTHRGTYGLGIILSLFSLANFAVISSPVFFSCAPAPMTKTTRASFSALGLWGSVMEVPRLVVQITLAAMYPSASAAAASIPLVLGSLFLVSGFLQRCYFYGYITNKEVSEEMGIYDLRQ